MDDFKRLETSVRDLMLKSPSEREWQDAGRTLMQACQREREVRRETMKATAAIMAKYVREADKKGSLYERCGQIEQVIIVELLGISQMEAAINQWMWEKNEEVRTVLALEAVYLSFPRKG